jgi:hypothetical protein
MSFGKAANDRHDGDLQAEIPRAVPQNGRNHPSSPSLPVL